MYKSFKIISILLFYYSAVAAAAAAFALDSGTKAGGYEVTARTGPLCLRGEPSREGLGVVEAHGFD